jgi:hypothetical protein
VVSLWTELRTQLVPDGNCLGGLVHSFNDQLAIVGNYIQNMGGIIDYNGSDNFEPSGDDDTGYDEYDNRGFVLPGAHPDQVANEEWFGLVDAERSPKFAYDALRELWVTVPDVRIELLAPVNGSPQARLSFTGTLQSSEDGQNWNDVIPQPTSPWVIPVQTNQQIYRAY